MRITLFATGLALVVPAAASAQADRFSLTTQTYTQDFNGLASTGSTGTALPQGFAVVESGSNANGSYGVSNGSGNNLAGNSYSFGAIGSSDRALGSVASGSVTQILYGGVFNNALGGTITDLAFSYAGEQWRLANSTDDGLTFQYQVGATGITGGSWTSVGSLFFAPLRTNGLAIGQGLDGNLAANRRVLSGTIGGLSLLDGQSFGFRWVDVNSAATDHGLAVDDLSITATLAAAAGVPEPASWAMMIGGFGLAGGALRRRARVVLA